tara:strand:- start:1221 stop:2060 length:840 start_codon:yes stop_codon:yes gene_type:complete
MSLGKYKLYTDDKGQERVMFVDDQGKPLSSLDMSKAQSDVMLKERSRLSIADEPWIKPVGGLEKGGTSYTLEDQVDMAGVQATDTGEVLGGVGDTDAANIKDIARANASAPTQQDVMPTNEIPLSDKEVEQAFLQTKESAGVGSGISSKQLSGASGLASGLAGMVGSESSGDAALSGALSGAAMGMSGAAMAGLAATGPVGIAVIAGSAVLGAFMGSRKAKKQRQAAEKAEKQRQKEIKEKRTEDVYTAKMNADQAAFANLQRAVSSALRRDNQVKIRT